MAIKLIFLFFYMFVLPIDVYSDEPEIERCEDCIFVNEIMPNPSTDDKQDEWVELFNKSDNVIDLEGYILKDAADHSLVIGEKYVENDSKIAGKGYLVVKRNGHSTFSLNNTNSETILLFTPDNVQMDSFVYTDSKVDRSWGRVPDGAEISSEMLVPSPGKANELPPTPTLVPTPSSKPTSTSKPTKTPTPPKSAGATSNSNLTQGTFRLTITPTEESLGENEETVGGDELILGVRNHSDKENDLSDHDGSDEDEPAILIAPLALIAGGLGFVGMSVYPWVKKSKIINKFMQKYGKQN